METEDGSHLAPRYRLMDAAARIMADEGYEGTSLRAIAARAQLTTGAIYAQFPGGKEDLFRSIFASVGQAVQRFVADTVVGTTDPLELLVLQAGALWDFFARYPSYAALLTRESVRGALGDPSPFVADNAELLAQLRALIDYAIAQGQIAPVNASHFIFWVTVTCITFHGCRPLRDALWPTADEEQARADFLRTLRKMLTPAPAAQG